MKKSILSAAVASALSLSATNALAAINLDNSSTSDPATYAQEIASENLTSALATGLDTIYTKVGFGIVSGNTDYFVRYDVSGGTFGNAVTASDLAMDASGNIVLSTGGAAGATSVIFNLQPTTGLADTGNITLSLANAGILLGTSAANVAIR